MTHPAVAEGVGMDYTPPKELLAIGQPDQDGASAGATASHAIPG